MKLKQLEPVEKIIGEYKFYIRPFPALKATNIMGELTSVLIPFFAALVPLVNEDTKLEDIDVGKATEALAKNVSIDGNKLEKMIQKFLLGGHIAVELENEDGESEGYKLDMDLLNEIFCGEIQNMFILCFYVIRINFSGFFGKFATQSGKVGEALQKIRKII